MGVTVIPFDFLETTSDINLTWYFSNYIKTAIELAASHDNLFVLYINSFSCTLDSFFQNYVRSEMHNKPYLFLELDAHTADAGIQTRLEAFLEIIKNYQASRIDVEEKPFQVTKVKVRGGKVVVLTSDGKQLDIKDPRVKLFLPSFSKYHTDAAEKALTLFGFNPGKTTDIKLEYPIKGLRCSSGKECIPLPIVLGQILTLVENRKPGDVIGLYMIRGGSPCAVFSYFQYIEHFLESNKIEDVFIYRFDYPTKYLGVKLPEVLRYAPVVIILGDLILEIESALQVVGEEGSLEMLKTYWSEFLENSTNKKKFRKNIKKLIRKIARIPRKSSPKDSPKVLISGDFFVRFSPFFLGELKEIYAKHGIIVKSSDLLELGVYGQNYMSGFLVIKEWNKDPSHFTSILRASATLWDEASRTLLIGKIGTGLMLRIERRLRRRFNKTGLLYAHPNDLGEIFRHSSPYISPLIFGEAIPTIGKGMETLEGSDFDSLILTGPFNCLPYKISQAILKPIYLEHNMPFLVFDVDISAITPNLKRLIHANIEQIKRRRSDPVFNEQMRIRSRIKRKVRNIISRRMSRVARRIEKKL
jgi:predicted nucleotide-binding protein (sugar kinase/HSP70/actin superfamily)